MISRTELVESVFGYAVNRTADGVSRVFLVYFIKGPDGIWRLDSM